MHLPLLWVPVLQLVHAPLRGRNLSPVHQYGHQGTLTSEGASGRDGWMPISLMMIMMMVVVVAVIF